MSLWEHPLVFSSEQGMRMGIPEQLAGVQRMSAGNPRADSHLL